MKPLMVCLLFLIATATGGGVCQAGPKNADPHDKSHAQYNARLGPALLDALRRGNAADFKALLDKGADPYTRDPTSSYRESALITASRGAPDIVKLLLNAGVDPNLPDEKGSDTPLMMAAMNGNLSIAQMLVAAGANVNAQDGNGYTALLNAAHFGNTQVAKFLVSKGANTNQAEYRLGSTPLMEAAFGGFSEIVSVLVANGANVKYKDPAGRTPLMEAGSTTSPETAKETVEKIAIIKLLLKQGVDVNAHDLGGGTAIMDTPYSTVAYQSEANAPGSDAPPANLEILKLLLASGADMNARDSQGQSLLLQAADDGNTDIVKLLLAKGVDVNQQDNDGKTALMLATEHSFENTVKALLKSRANVNLKDHDGATALSEATDPDIIRLLHKASANA